MCIRDRGSIYTLSADWTLDAETLTEGWYAIRVTARNNSDKTAVSTVKCRYCLLYTSFCWEVWRWAPLCPPCG